MNTVLAHGLFGTKHIIILVVCLLLIVLGFIFSKKLSFEKIIKVMLGVGIVSEVIKVFNNNLDNLKKLLFTMIENIPAENNNCECANTRANSHV